jgi:hypothetical protein
MAADPDHLGGHDRIIPVRHAAVAHAAMPGSELDVFSSAGHFPHHDDPAGFVATVQRFMARTRPSQYDPARWCQLLRGEEQAAPEFTEQTHASSGS